MSLLSHQDNSNTLAALQNTPSQVIQPHTQSLSQKKEGTFGLAYFQYRSIKALLEDCLHFFYAIYCKNTGLNERRFLQCGPCSWKQRRAGGPPASVAPDNIYPIVLPLLTGSTLLLEDFVDVFHFAKSLKEGDQIEELGV